MDSQKRCSKNKAHPFTSTNYAFWKVRMKTSLMFLGVELWVVVLVVHEEPKEMSSDKDEKLEFTPNAKFLNALISRLSEPQFIKVKHCKIAKQYGINCKISTKEMPK